MIRSQRLKWDSEYFDIPCARIDLEGTVGQPDLELHLASLKTAKLITIFNYDMDARNSDLISQMTRAKLVDVNVQFEKILPGEHQRGISAKERYQGSEKLLDLADIAFPCSRFTSDERLLAAGGAHVYREWVKNAFNRYGKYFVVLGDDDAFSLFHIDGDSLVLELIAVSPERRSSGLGRLMWQVLEREARHLGAHKIHVGVPLGNTRAIKFYHAMGCEIQSTAQIYHWWL